MANAESRALVAEIAKDNIVADALARFTIQVAEVVVQHERRALWLVAENGCAVLKMERAKGDWVELIRESLDGPFSHIIEPGGIQTALARGDANG